MAREAQKRAKEIRAMVKPTKQKAKNAVDQIKPPVDPVERVTFWNAATLAADIKTREALLAIRGEEPPTTFREIGEALEISAAGAASRVDTAEANTADLIEELDQG